MSNSKLQSLSEIFNSKIFRIPDFQRGYSWGENQLNDFWDDIQNLHSQKSHYIGLLTVEPIDSSYIQKSEKWQEDQWLLDKGMSAYYIIDGQQRLTTVIILLHEILKELKDDEEINYDAKRDWVKRFLYCTSSHSYKSFIFGYEKDNPSDEFFKTKILEQNSSSADKYPETLYTANLMFAKEFFANKLKDLSEEQKGEIFAKVVKNLKFNFYEIDDSLDVYVTFETMNNRGKELSKLELLKNRLIYLSTLLPESDETKNRLRKDINETWKTVYEYLGKNKDNPLDDDDFLFNHWIMYYTYNRSGSEMYADYLLKKQFTTKNIGEEPDNVSFKSIKDYIDSLADCVKQWFYLHNIQYSNYTNRIKEMVQKLERVKMYAFPPMIMAVLKKENNELDIYKFLSVCERFNFLVFAVSHRSSHTQNNNIYKMARQYYNDELNIHEIIQNINFLIDGVDENYYCGWFDLDRFKSHITELFTKNNKDGFYSWNGLRYFLYEYELSLQASANPKVSWEDFNKRTREDTIEHIYPQTATEKYWKEKFKKIQNKPTQKRLYLNSLGNLLLLSRSKNSTLQNYDFQTKKRLKDKQGNIIGYQNGSFSEIEVAYKKDWTPRDIEERGLLMLEFMEKRWGFKFKDWEINKLEVLFPTKK